MFINQVKSEFKYGIKEYNLIVSHNLLKWEDVRLSISQTFDSLLDLETDILKDIKILFFSIL